MTVLSRRDKSGLVCSSPVKSFENGAQRGMYGGGGGCKGVYGEYSAASVLQVYQAGVHLSKNVNTRQGFCSNIDEIVRLVANLNDS